MNDVTIIKAEMCDFLSARTKNLANIQNMDDREVYIGMLVDASSQIENLTALFSQFEKVDEILGFNQNEISNTVVETTNSEVSDASENIEPSNTTIEPEVETEEKPVEAEVKAEPVPEKEEVKEEPKVEEKPAEVASEPEVKTEDKPVEVEVKEEKTVEEVALENKESSDAVTIDEKPSEPVVENDIKEEKTVEENNNSVVEGVSDNIKENISETSDVSSNLSPLPFATVDTNDNKNEVSLKEDIKPVMEEKTENNNLPFTAMVPDTSKNIEDDSNKNSFSDIFKGIKSDNETNSFEQNVSASNVPNDNSSMKILKMKPDRVKAILVSQKQIMKLRNSKDLQKSYLDFGIFQPSNVSGENDVQKQIEGLMAQASALYKEGKMQEAQDLYAKISELNKNNMN